MLQVFLTPDYLAIVMEFANGGDMFQLVVANRGLPEQDARWYFQQLIIAVDYCHKMVHPGSFQLEAQFNIVKHAAFRSWT